MSLLKPQRSFLNTYLAQHVAGADGILPYSILQHLMVGLVGQNDAYRNMSYFLKVSNHLVLIDCMTN